jgi:5'-nucleotidase
MLYIDQDGVLADFDAAIKLHLGGSCEEVGDDRIAAEVPKIKDFWINIPPKQDFMRLWEFVQPFNPCILTASANWDRDRCVESKPIWLMKHLPNLIPENIRVVRRSEKAHYALRYANQPNVLVDDFTVNTSEWARAGGVPVLHLSASQSVRELKKLRNYYS